ncbi:MAG: hypothetical protein IPO36_18630 [Anaerolineales bacterium]|nr:hypothetical protein [Anaerolineales bacterium]
MISTGQHVLQAEHQTRGLSHRGGDLYQRRGPSPGFGAIGEFHAIETILIERDAYHQAMGMPFIRFGLKSTPKLGRFHSEIGMSSVSIHLPIVIAADLRFQKASRHVWREFSSSSLPAFPIR